MNCQEKCELNNLQDLLDPVKNREFEYVFVTDSDGKQHVVSKHDLIRQLQQAKSATGPPIANQPNGGPIIGEQVANPQPPAAPVPRY